MKPFERYDLLREVNDEVNRNTRYRPEAELYAQRDFWEIAAREGEPGDCALAKRQRLLERGVPVEDLALCVVFTNTEEGKRRLELKRSGVDMPGDHAVLIGTSPIGDWILDDRFTLPVQLAETGYTVDRVQARGALSWRAA